MWVIFIWIGFIFGGTKKITFQEPQTPDAVVKSHDNFYNIFYLFSVKPSILNPKVETLAVPDWMYAYGESWWWRQWKDYISEDPDHQLHIDIWWLRVKLFSFRSVKLSTLYPRIWTLNVIYITCMKNLCIHLFFDIFASKNASNVCRWGNYWFSAYVVNSMH